MRWWNTTGPLWAQRACRHFHTKCVYLCNKARVQICRYVAERCNLKPFWGGKELTDLRRCLRHRSCSLRRECSGKRGRKKCFIMFVIPTVETGKEPQNDSQMTTQKCWKFNLPRKRTVMSLFPAVNVEKQNWFEVSFKAEEQLQHFFFFFF